MKIRRFVRAIHRDIGYVAFGLTIIYSISGVAVNHVADWNPNYIISKDTLIVSSNIDSTLTSEEIVQKLISYFSIKDSIKNFFRSNPNSIDIFFDKKTLSADLRSRIAILENVESSCGYFCTCFNYARIYRSFHDKR